MGRRATVAFCALLTLLAGSEAGAEPVAFTGTLSVTLPPSAHQTTEDGQEGSH